MLGVNVPTMTFSYPLGLIGATIRVFASFRKCLKFMVVFLADVEERGCVVFGKKNKSLFRLLAGCACFLLGC